MADMDLGHLYDDEDLTVLGGGHLYDDEPLGESVPDDLLHRSVVVYQGMTPLVNAYGNTTVPKYFDSEGNVVDARTVIMALRSADPVSALAAYTPDVHKVYCCVVGRTQKNSVMSENWAQDTTPQSVGGNREMNQVKVLAPEWHGDFYSRFWHEGSCYEVDGSPVYLPDSSDAARHYEFPARRVYAAELARNKVSPPTPPEGAAVWGM